MDLLSAIIRLRARQSAQNIGFLGRHVQAWFLREIERHASDLSSQLHEEPGSASSPSLFRPYTLSTLIKGEYPPREIVVGDWCSIRVTSLTQELSDLLINKVLPNMIPVNRIGPVEFEIEVWKEGPPDRVLVQSDSYANIMRMAMASDDVRVGLDFTSPTTFKQRIKKGGIDKDYPLPAPNMVFGSYLNHWSAFSGATIEAEFGEFIEECLAINELRIRSERVEFSRQESQRAATGYVGQVRFIALGGKEKSRFGSKWDYYANVCLVLALYSFYCGTGHHTTIGMGQTRLLPARSPR